LYDKPAQRWQKKFIKNGETYRNVSEIQNFILALFESGVMFVELVKDQKLTIQGKFVEKREVSESKLLFGSMFLESFQKQIGRRVNAK
jgi:hypothetical protein